MNQDTIQGNWKQMRGAVLKTWGSLTDNDLDVIAGDREKLLGKIQERYGIARDDAEKQLKDFERDRDSREAA